MSENSKAYDAYAACHRNAQAFVDDARRLISTGSYGHAIALLVLAEEELGKSFLWTFEAMGIHLPGKVFRSHTKKQSIEVFAFLSLELFLDEHREEFMHLLDEEDATERDANLLALVEKLMKRIEGSAGTPAIGRMLEEFRRLQTIEAKKQAGLYVNVSNTGELSTPQEMTKDEAEAYRQLVEKRLLRPWGPSTLTEKQVEEVARVWAPVIETMVNEIPGRVSSIDDWRTWK